MSNYIRTKDDIYEAYREIEVKPLSNSINSSSFPNESGYFAKTRNREDVFIPKKDVIKIMERFYEELCDCFVLKYKEYYLDKEHIKVFDTYEERYDFIKDNEEQFYSFTTYGAIYTDNCIKYVILMEKDGSTVYEFVKDKVD